MSGIMDRISAAMAADPTFIPGPNVMNALTNYQRLLATMEDNVSDTTKIDKIVERALKHADKIRTASPKPSHKKPADD